MRVVKELDSEIKEIARAFGIDKTTAFQDECAEEILKGEEVLVIGETGSGKTEAVMIPLFKLLKEKRPISCIYITPLRALNRDIFSRLIKAGEKIGLNVEIRHGDTPTSIRKQQLKDPPHILITTPETLQIIAVAPKFKEHLKNVNYVVIDEIHEFAGNKRGAQLSFMIKRLKKITNFKLIGLSATVSNAEKVSRYFWGKNIKVIENKQKKKKILQVIIPEIDEKSKKMADELEISVNAASKIQKIIEIIDNKSTLIFTNTRPMAEILASRLKKIVKSEVHHGSLSKEYRENVEKMLKNGKIKSVIATSSLELGIDIGHIEQVIHYGSPRRVDVFTQRVGRSGHWIEKPSIGFIICDAYEAPESGVIAKFTIEGNLEPMKFVKNALDVLAHQIVGLALENDEVRIEEAFRMVKECEAFSGISEKEFKEVLGLMHYLGIISVNEKTFRRRKKAWKYYYENVSMMPDDISFTLIDINSQKRIAKLDAGFVEEIEVGDVFVVGGRSWQMISKENGRVYAALYNEVGEAAIWVGEIIPVEKMVAEKIPDAIKNPEEYPFDKKTSEIIKSLGSYDEKVVRVEKYKDFVIFMTFAGTKINNTLAALIGSFMSAQFGESTQTKSDHIGIAVKGNVQWDIMRYINEEKIESTLRRIMPFLPYFRSRFLEVAKRFGVVERGATAEKIGIKKLIEFWKDSPIYEETVREILRDKFDVEGCKEFIKKIKEGKIRIKEEKVSKLGRLLVERLYPEIIDAEKPTMRILMNVKERLLRKKVKLYCFNCKTYLGEFSVKSAPEKCPICGAKYIGMIKNPKLMKKRDLSVKEKRELEGYKLSANLFLSYGKKALIVMAGKGIGPKTAARILSSAQDEIELLQKIVEAEKLYARTRPFWD